LGGLGLLAKTSQLRGKRSWRSGRLIGAGRTALDPVRDGDLDADRYQPRLKLLSVLLTGGLLEAVLAWFDGEIPVTRAELIDEGARLCIAAAENVRRSVDG
jgi:hypothetical protein